MKNLILAAALAFASVLPIATPSEAASVVISADGAHVRTGDHDRRYERRMRAERRLESRHSMSRHCYIKTMKHKRHGRTIIERVRVCR